MRVRICFGNGMYTVLLMFYRKYLRDPERAFVSVCFSRVSKPCGFKRPGVFIKVIAVKEGSSKVVVRRKRVLSTLR